MAQFRFREFGLVDCWHRATLLELVCWYQYAGVIQVVGLKAYVENVISAAWIGLLVDADGSFEGAFADVAPLFYT